MYDIIVIGCGPAGMTAAIYALRAGKKVLIIEKENIGGQISSSPLVENYPGYIGISGAELTGNMYDQVINLGGDIELEEVTSLKGGKIKEVICENTSFKAKSVIIATGARYRLLGLPNEVELIGNGIHFCVACDGAFYKDKIACVIGGGNSAIVNAMTLSDICKKVYVIQNLSDLTGEKVLGDKLKKKDNVEIYYNSVVKEIIGEDELKAIVINNVCGDIKIDTDAMFISIGLVPQSKFLDGIVDLNDYKYISSDNSCTTSMDGVFVAGDVKDKKIRQLTTAVNDGTIAALSAIDYLDKE